MAIFHVEGQSFQCFCSSFTYFAGMKGWIVNKLNVDDEVAFQSISLMCYLVVARLDLVGSAGYVWLVLLVTLVMFGCLGVESIS